MDFYDNQITVVTIDAFKDSPKLKYLNLNQNLLTNVCFLDSITSLLKIDLSYNQIEILQPDLFEHLTELRDINLRTNQLTSFDSNFFEHKNLRNYK